MRPQQCHILRHRLEMSSKESLWRGPLLELPTQVQGFETEMGAASMYMYMAMRSMGNLLDLAFEMHLPSFAELLE